jgi:hypothetical protein
LGLTAGLLGGGAAGLVLGGPAVSGAQSTDTTVPSTTAPSTTAPGTNGAPQGDWEAQALAPLVANGTITQAQADAVVAALAAARPEHAMRGGHGFADLDAAAAAIGIDSPALRDALTSGQSLADVARAHNVDPQVVIDALVASAKTHLADDVSSGRLTQAEADQRLADIQSHITDLVNGTLPSGPPDGGPGRGPGGGPGMFGTAPGSGSSSSGSSSSGATTQGASVTT